MRTLQLMLLITGCLTFLTNTAAAQYYPGKNDTTPNLSNEEQQRRNQEQQQRAIEIRDKIIDRARKIDILPPKRPDERTEEEKAEAKEIFDESRAVSEETQRMLLPPTAFYKKYAEQLKDEKTHLARIFVDKNCDAGKIVAIEEIERCADVIPVKGGGSFYSFRFQNNNHFNHKQNWWDLHFINGKFVVGNDTVQGIIHDVGKVKLENADLESDQLDFLGDFEPQKTLATIKEQNMLLERGFVQNGFTYYNQATAGFGHTYVVRSIAYRLKEERRVPWLGNQETGIDITVAFEIVGRGSDGSLVLLWKELKSETPRLTLDNTVKITK